MNPGGRHDTPVPHAGAVEIRKGDALIREGTKLVVAVHDNFTGITYRGLRRHYADGTILRKALVHETKKFEPLTEGKESVLYFRVMRKVHVNTVKALQRKIGDTRQLHPGRIWHEVHGD